MHKYFSRNFGQKIEYICTLSFFFDRITRAEDGMFFSHKRKGKFQSNWLAFPKPPHESRPRPRPQPTSLLNPSRLSPSWLPPLPRSAPLFHAPPPPAGVAFHLNRRAGKHLINHPPLRRPVPNPSLPPAPPRRDAARTSCAPVRRGFVRARIDFLSAR